MRNSFALSVAVAGALALSAPAQANVEGDTSFFLGA